MQARHAAVEPGATIGLGLQVDPPEPIPSLRLSLHRLMGSELRIEQLDSGEPAGPVTLTMGLLEALITPVRLPRLTPQVSVGAGFIHYGFPSTDDDEVAAMIGDRKTSAAISLGLGGSIAVGRAVLMVEAADIVSTFDSPPVESQQSPGQMVDIDEVQHDLRFTIGLRYPLRLW